MNSAIYICIGLAIYLLIILFIYKKQQKNHPTSLLLETNGIFNHDKASGITCILSGIFLMSLFVFIGFKDSEATLSGLFVGLGLGIFFSLVGICFLLFNFAYILYNKDAKWHFLRINDIILVAYVINSFFRTECGLLKKAEKSALFYCLLYCSYH